MASTARKSEQLVEHWDDERKLGNGIIVTLRPGLYFYDRCGVQGFDTIKEAKAAVAAIAKKMGLKP